MSWQKLLARMVSAQKRTGFNYADCTTVLKRLGFELQTGSGTSHRKWRLERPGHPPVYIGLVDRGKAELPRGYIDTMVRILQDRALLPKDGDPHDD